MKKIILFFSLVMLFSIARAQYVDKASVVNSINANVQRAPATPLRGDTLNKILNGLANFAGSPSTSVTKNLTNDSFIVTTNGIRSALKDSAGGSSTPFLFGINDVAMGQDRYMNIKDHQFYYDFDGNRGNANYVQFGHQGYKSFDTYFQDIGNSFIWAESYTDSAGAALFSGGIDGTANIFVHDSVAEISSAKHGKSSNLVITGSSATLKRTNDNIAKNIITSVNNQLADSSGNINHPQFTIAQRNVLPTPSLGFTAFITDATANDASVGVNQSWDGTAWRNNW